MPFSIERPGLTAMTTEPTPAAKPSNGFEMETASVAALFVAKATRLPMKSVPTVVAETQRGLAGDRYEGTRHRHVSVFSTGEMADANERYGSVIDPALTRRNVLLEAGRLPRAPGTRLTIGDVELEVVRDAAPCKMLDSEIGDGAKTAMRRRAGVICRVLEGGTITVGDPAEYPAVED